MGNIGVCERERESKKERVSKGTGNMEEAQVEAHAESLL